METVTKHAKVSKNILIGKKLKMLELQVKPKKINAVIKLYIAKAKYC